MPATRVGGIGRLFGLHGELEPQERRALVLAFVCHFVLFASYYILRPVRDTAATIFGPGQLQWLFTGTFVGTFIASPIYGALASHLRLSRLLPGVFWFWCLNVLLFAYLFHVDGGSRWVIGGYYIWFSVVNLFMVSVFWSLMVDLFTAEQAKRLFAPIAAGGSLGAIAGPLVTRLLVKSLGLSGLLLVAAVGFLLVIMLVYWLMRQKDRMRQGGGQTQRSSLDHGLSGNPFEGFGELWRSRLSRQQALFMLLMTWINTIGYFFQTDLVSQAFSGVTSRTQALADISLWVNICTAVLLIFGVGRFVQRFGVTAGLSANPVLMVLAFIGVALSPTLLMIQALQVVRSVAQYAIARPSREMVFTVAGQKSRYKTKNVIDTVVYRFGDLSSAWMQAGLRAAGVRLPGAAAVGCAASVLWLASALRLGREYEKIRKGDAVVNGDPL